MATCLQDRQQNLLVAQKLRLSGLHVAGPCAAMLADGFPRTALQVDFLKLLFDKLMALHGKHADGPEENRFPRPSFKVWIVGASNMLRCNCTQHNHALAGSWQQLPMS